MNEKEKEAADILIKAIIAADAEEKRLCAVAAYRDFMAAVHCRVTLERMS